MKHSFIPSVQRLGLWEEKAKYKIHKYWPLQLKDADLNSPKIVSSLEPINEGGL